MRSKVIITLIVMLSLGAGIWLVFEEPFWGFASPFPFTVLRSIELPLAIGIPAVLLAFATKSAEERKLLYSVIIAALAELVVIEVMIWLDRPELVIAVLVLNAFMALQFLRYGCVFVWARNRTSESTNG